MLATSCQIASQGARLPGPDTRPQVAGPASLASPDPASMANSNCLDPKEDVGLPSLCFPSWPAQAGTLGPHPPPEPPDMSRWGWEVGFWPHLSLNIFHVFVYSLHLLLGPCRFTGSGICMPFFAGNWVHFVLPAASPLPYFCSSLSC